MEEISEQASDHMASSRLIEEDEAGLSPKTLKIDEIPLDTPGRSRTTKIELYTPRILIH